MLNNVAWSPKKFKTLSKKMVNPKKLLLGLLLLFANQCFENPFDWGSQTEMIIPIIIFPLTNKGSNSAISWVLEG
jgi:hypothetical protein